MTKSRLDFGGQFLEIWAAKKTRLEVKTGPGYLTRLPGSMVFTERIANDVKNSMVLQTAFDFALGTAHRTPRKREVKSTLQKPYYF